MTREVETGSCATCAAWSPAEGDADIGVCYRKSPQVSLVVVEGDGGEKVVQSFTAWPETSAEQGCMEFVAKELLRAERRC